MISDRSVETHLGGANLPMIGFPNTMNADQSRQQKGCGDGSMCQKPIQKKFLTPFSPPGILLQGPIVGSSPGDRRCLATSILSTAGRRWARAHIHGPTYQRAAYASLSAQKIARTTDMKILGRFPLLGLFLGAWQILPQQTVPSSSLNESAIPL